MTVTDAMIYDQADYFLVPLLDGTHALGQIVAVRDMPAGAILAAFCLRRADPGSTPKPLALSEVIALLLIDPADIAAGHWPLAGFDQLPATHRVLDHRTAPLDEMPIHSGPVIEAFLNACHGLYPWDGFPDPAFFDGLLRSPENRPAGVVLGK